MTRQGRRASRRWFALLALGGLFGAGLAPAQAQDLEKLDAALRWVPADVSFYSTWLRNQEQIDAVAQSRAWAKLTALPAVQRAWKLVKDEWTPNGKLGPAAQFFQQPENRQLLELVGDMVSQEVFVYGGKDLAGTLQLLQKAQSAGQFAPLSALLAGNFGALGQENLQARAVLQALAGNLELVQIPDLVFGFRVPDTRRAQDQLKRLEELLQQVPPLKDRLKRAQVAGGEFLTLTLDGSLVPWDEIPFKDFEEKPGEFDGVVKKLKGLQVVVSLGTRDKYVLLSVGPSNDHLARLGQGPRLLDRPELKPLAPFAGRRLTSVHYASKELRERATTTTRDVDDLVKWIGEALPQDKLTAAQREQLQKDLAALGADLKKYLPKPGASLGFTFLNGRGQEGYGYDWSEYPSADYSKPLTILNHVGGDPVLAWAGRSAGTLDAYKALSKWARTAHERFEEIVLPALDEGIREQYKAVAGEVVPFLRRLDEITATMFLPALADGQSAFVLDAKLVSQRWLQALPLVSDQPLPLPEPALVLGVSDAALLVKAADAYRALANEVIAKARMLVPLLPEFSIPPPESRKVKEGTLYSYALPGEWGVDKQLAPTAGVAERVAALTLSPVHAQRLLASTPLKVDGGPLANAKAASASAVYFNFPALLDGLAPWLDVAVTAGGADLAKALGEEGEQGLARVRQQMRTALDVLKTIRGYTSRTYRDGDKVVTHSETVIQDLKP